NWTTNRSPNWSLPAAQLGPSVLTVTASCGTWSGRGAWDVFPRRADKDKAGRPAAGGGTHPPGRPGTAGAADRGGADPGPPAVESARRTCPVSRRGWALFAAVGVIWGIPYLLIKVADAGVSGAGAGVRPCLPCCTSN